MHTLKFPTVNTVVLDTAVNHFIELNEMKENDSDIFFITFTFSLKN